MTTSTRPRPDAVEAGLSEQLAARIARLEAELVVAKQQQRDAADGQFLRAVALAIGERIFSVGDLCEHATIDPDLRAALSGRRPKQLGKCFARLANRDVQGLCVRRVKLEATGWLWKVDFHEVLVDRA